MVKFYILLLDKMSFTRWLDRNTELCVDSTSSHGFSSKCWIITDCRKKKKCSKKAMRNQNL